MKRGGVCVPRGLVVVCEAAHKAMHGWKHGREGWSRFCGLNHHRHSETTVACPTSLHNTTRQATHEQTRPYNTQMPLPPPPPATGRDYHRLPAGDDDAEETTPTHLPPLPAHVNHAAVDDDDPPPESPWALLGRTSDTNDDGNEEDEAEREALHLPPPAPLLPWTMVQTPREAQEDEDADAGKQRRCHQKWLWLLPRFFMMPPSIFRWLPGYTKAQFWGDLLGGLTVAVMVIPQGE